MKRLRLSILTGLLLFLWLCPGRGWAQSEDAVGPATPAANNPDTERPLEGLDKRIFLDLRDINVVDVLKFLALEGNLNIVTSKNVQGRSTLLLKNVSIRDALDIIIISNQLAYDIKNEIIYVMAEEEYQQLYGKSFNDKKKIVTRVLQYAKPSYVSTALQSVASAIGKIIVDEETGTVILIDTDEKLMEMNAVLDQIEHRMDTEVIKLQYADVTDVAAQLKTQLDAKGVGTVMGDARSNQLVVSAYPDRMKEVLPLVKSLDVKKKIVLIEARILQLTINPEYDYGIDWDAFFSTRSIEPLGDLSLRGAFPIDSTVSSATALNSVGKLGIGELGMEDYNAELKALKQVEKTNLLANPRLMVQDRQEAKINIGDTIPYVVTTTTGTGTNVSVSEDIRFVNVGLSLVVTPIIHDDNYITMQIRPEISSRTGTLVTAANAQIPLVNTSSLESTLVVKDGVTVILGGLRREDYGENTKGVPYLMDIPFLGKLFQSRADSLLKTEIVVFITPKIVTGEENITGEPLDILRSPLPRGRGLKDPDLPVLAPAKVAQS